MVKTLLIYFAIVIATPVTTDVATGIATLVATTGDTIAGTEFAIEVANDVPIAIATYFAKLLCLRVLHNITQQLSLSTPTTTSSTIHLPMSIPTGTTTPLNKDK